MYLKLCIFINLVVVAVDAFCILSGSLILDHCF